MVFLVFKNVSLRRIGTIYGVTAYAKRVGRKAKTPRNPTPARARARARENQNQQKAKGKAKEAALHRNRYAISTWVSSCVLTIPIVCRQKKRVMAKITVKTGVMSGVVPNPSPSPVKTWGMIALGMTGYA